MKFAMYYPYLYLRGGIERTILEQLKSSRNEWTVFTNHYDTIQTFQDLRHFDIRETPCISVERSYLKVAFAALRILKTRLPLSDYGALLVHTEGMGDFITFANHEKPIVAYCHTPLKLIHDDAVRKSYLKANPHLYLPYLLCSRLFRFVDQLAWRYYRRVFCNSREVKRRILRAKLSASEKIEVLHPGVDTEVFVPRGGGYDYFVHPTRIKWWKNIELAIQSFNIFCGKNKGDRHFKLIVCGLLDKESIPYYNRLVKLASNNERIVIITNPKEEEFVRLIQESYAVLNTTLNEDWGLVPLEANACAKPLIGVCAGGLGESQTNRETALLVDPTPEQFAEAMLELADNKELVDVMRRKGRANALSYRWEDFSKRIDDYLESVAFTCP